MRSFLRLFLIALSFNVVGCSTIDNSVFKSKYLREKQNIYFFYQEYPPSAESQVYLADSLKELFIVKEVNLMKRRDLEIEDIEVWKTEDVRTAEARLRLRHNLTRDDLVIMYLEGELENLTDGYRVLGVCCTYTGFAVFTEEISDSEHITLLHEYIHTLDVVSSDGNHCANNSCLMHWISGWELCPACKHLLQHLNQNN